MQRPPKSRWWLPILLLLALPAAPGCGGLLLHRLLHPCCRPPGDCCQLGCGEIYWGDHTVDVGPDPCCHDAPRCQHCR